MVPAPAGGDGASCEGLWFSIALVSTKMTDVAFDSAELVVRRALRSFDQKKSAGLCHIEQVEAVFDRGEETLRHWNRVARLSPGRQ